MSDSWTVDRRAGEAGCRCGEVIPVWFDDEAPPSSPLSATARKPVRWSETQLPGAWSGRLRIGRRRLLPLVLVVPYLAFRIALLSAHSSTAVAAAVAVAVVATLALTVGLMSRSVQLWIRDGRFGVDLRGSHWDFALDEVLRFSAHRHDRRDSAGRLRDAAPYYLVVHSQTRGPTRIPLQVVHDEEAQFIADRLNAVLANGGRDVEAGYRGEKLRIAEADEPPPLRVGDDAASTVASRADADEEDEQEPSKRRLGAP